MKTARLKRYEVPQAFRDRKHGQRAAPIFGQIWTVECLGLGPCGQKMRVVDERVFDPGFGQRAREIRFPHAFGQPESHRLPSESGLEPRGLLCNLPAAIVLWNGGQDRFMKSARQKLDLSALYQVAQSFQVFGVRSFEPGQKRSGMMRADPDTRMPGQHVEEWSVRLAVHALEHVFEIAERLMIMDDEQEGDRRQDDRRLKQR